MMDQKSRRILEFDKILDKLGEYAAFSASHDLVTALEPSIDQAEIERWQRETGEAKKLLSASNEYHVGGAHDVRPAVERSTRGIILLANDFLDIRSTLIASRELSRKLERVREAYPSLFAIAELIEEVPGLVAAIGQTLDDRGEVLDTASPKLGTIRRDLRVTHGRIQDRLRGIINSHAVHLQDPIISMRGGRYVLPVRADSKGRIRGIVHDTSSSGATVWIEPMSTVDLNNQYRELQIDEEKEVQRLLAELTEQVAHQEDVIRRVVDRLAELDFIFAKAKYALHLDAIAPDFVDWAPYNPETLHPGSRLWIKGARHPLLEQKTVVPTDLTVPEDVFLILITGPNTGGKTVSLKTAGLMIMMAQSGLHIPCVDARLTLFDNVLADIGDEQSIEQNLSTFSAHMTNIIRILEQVDDRSLVLFDELGSGTDPAEGAALAQAIIDFLRDKGATVFTATHYPELKAYATSVAGATNASLLFDIETLSPTYEMTIGIPGKSNALAIARRLGLDESVLDGAMNHLGHGSSETEQLLDSIYDMREKIASEEASARLARRRAEREVEKLQERYDDIEVEKQKVILETRAQVEAELESIRAEIRNVRQELKHAESKNMLKRLSREVTNIENRPLSAVTETPILDEVIKKEKAAKPRKLQVGDEVFIKTIKAKGEVTSVSKNEAEVAVGRLHMRAKLEELEFKGRPVRFEEPVVKVSAPKSPGLELDIRGRRVDSGLEELDRFLDAAILSRMPFVRIIHGKGTGKLRAAVRKALNQYSAVSNWEEGKDGEGGAGVTVVRFKEG